MSGAGGVGTPGPARPARAAGRSTVIPLPVPVPQSEPRRPTADEPVDACGAAGARPDRPVAAAVIGARRAVPARGAATAPHGAGAAPHGAGALPRGTVA
ncbi:hypothetical protein OPKNFCMD_2035 [Methylobacterium crusticola]|uniref:Uncharacterized protein n=1 Tax=Methylobacterium crusticola TaxID=1697972 RepID=A0ABQ4QVC8_9HYPH|nr:hypothetical protein OPKNFCMD_2035 [Methylobacterium crusticola]